MNAFPQVGAGGVPLHHEDDGAPARRGQPAPPPRPPDTVKTVRAGTPVAEQKAPGEPPEAEDRAGK
ncbi:hypothetical protein [Kitasatospora sp. NPDC047058]|uniref:hypothetical protein n=1 Tax=Kitasatospora sp. NPDC047058 TaxID=3155620 RepID=UPI0033FA1AEE